MERPYIFFRLSLLFTSLLFSGLLAFAQKPFPDSAQKCFEEGELRFDKEDYDEAILYFNECLRLQANFAEAYYWRGQAYEQVNRLPFALNDYTSYLQLVPQNPEALFNRGRVHYLLEQFQQAKEDFTKLLAQPAHETNTVYFRRDVYTGGVNQLMTTHQSSRGQIFQLLGLAETKLNNYAGAVLAFDSALHYMPGDADLYVNRGIAHQNNNQHKLALDDFRQALKINPSHSIAKSNLRAFNKSIDSAETASLDTLIAAAHQNPNGNS